MPYPSLKPLLACALAAALPGVALAANTIFINGFEGEPANLAGITAAHNAVRAGVGVGPLFWDGRLAASAQAWADRCVDTDRNGLVDHNGARSLGFPWYVGENIYGASGTASAAQAVGLWAAEVAYYDYDRNNCAAGRVCGHYTQVVWANSLLLGCGLSHCPALTYKNAIVCDYGPGGNYNGERPY